MNKSVWVAQVYQQCGNQLYCFIRRLTGNDPDADDVFQETWRKVLATEAELPSHSEFRWLCTISKNLWRDGFRRDGCRIAKATGGDSQGDNPGRHAVNPTGLQKLLAAERQKVLRACISSLDEAFRITIQLRFFELLTDEEISESLGINKITVATRVLRAKQKLADCMAKKGLS